MSPLPGNTRGWGPTSLSSQLRGPAERSPVYLRLREDTSCSGYAGPGTGHAAVGAELSRVEICGRVLPLPGLRALASTTPGGPDADPGWTHMVVKAPHTCASDRESTRERRAGLRV